MSFGIGDIIIYLVHYGGLIVTVALACWGVWQCWKNREIEVFFAIALFIIIGLLSWLTDPSMSDDGITDSDEAFDYLYALQDYITQTGDTDMYLHFLEDMDSDYLRDFIEDHIYTEDLVHDAYYEGYDEGYEHGLETGYENGWSDGWYEAGGE